MCPHVFTPSIPALFMQYTAHKTDLRVWSQPDKEPLVDVDRAVLITVHHQAAVLIRAAIRSLPQGHVLLAPADMALLTRIALTYYV